MLRIVNNDPDSVGPSFSRSKGTYILQFQQQQHVAHARTFVEHISQLDIDHAPSYVRQTTIVCTLGKNWNTDEQIESMIKGGMNIMRLNLSMGTPSYYADAIERVRAIELARSHNPCVGVAVDISSPPVRTGLINEDVDAVMDFDTGQMVKLTVSEKFKNTANSELIWIDSQFFPELLSCAEVGDCIYLDEGMLSLTVKSKTSDTLDCIVDYGGELGSLKRVQFPFERIYKKTYETTYKSDLKFAVENKVDFVFTGYASTAEQVIEAKNILGEEILLFVKIETREAVRNLHSIMDVADGIIIGRGNLGLVYPAEKVIQLQKQIIAKCNIMNKPVFVITQLLESMRFKPRPTRAEISDVANAVLDGADGLILTVETSRGLYPRETLSVMQKTCREAESAIYHEKFWLDLKLARELRGLSSVDPPYFTALAAVEASSSSRASAIFVITTTGRSAVAIASLRPFCPVIAIMRRPEVGRRCHSIRGIHPYIYTGEKLNDWCEDMDIRINAGIQFARNRGFVSDGDRIVLVTGWEAGTGSTNTVRVLELPSKGTMIKVVDSRSQLCDGFS